MVGDGKGTDEAKEGDHHPPLQLFSRGCSCARAYTYSLRLPPARTDGKVSGPAPLGLETKILVSHRHNHGSKVGGTSRWVDADPLPPPSLSRLPLLLRPCFSAHSLPYRFFSSPREIGKEVRGSTIRFSRCPGKWQLVAKVGGDRMPLVPVISEVGRDASHRSHRPVAPVWFRLDLTAEISVSRLRPVYAKISVSAGLSLPPPRTDRLFVFASWRRCAPPRDRWS